MLTQKYPRRGTRIYLCPFHDSQKLIQRYVKVSSTKHTNLSTARLEESRKVNSVTYKNILVEGSTDLTLPTPWISKADPVIYSPICYIVRITLQSSERIVDCYRWFPTEPLRTREANVAWNRMRRAPRWNRSLFTLRFKEYGLTAYRKVNVHHRRYE